MIKAFMRMRAWQVFLLLVVAPGVTCYGVFAARGPESPATALAALPFMVLVWVWIAMVGLAADERAPEPVRKRTIWFRLSALYVCAYTAAFLLLFYLTLTGRVNPSVGFKLMPLIMPLHLLAMVASIYAMLFAARRLAMAQDGGSKVAREPFLWFLLLGFFPVGVWFVQPRVNALAGRSPVLPQ
jgi:hypothetical protein